MNKKITVYDIALIALLTAILSIQEMMLSFIPNVQLTVFLLILFSKKLGFTKTSLIILIHVLIDNLVMGSFNVIYVPFMFLGWMMIPILLCTVFKKINSNITLAFISILFALIYSWVYIIPNVIITEVDAIAYLVADIPWEIILALSSFISTLLLYNPCVKLFDKFNIK